MSPQLKEYLNQNQDKQIVFTNGCFDILHPGHVTYLTEAKGLADILIVGLNSDSSVKRIKSNDRPINTLNHRKLILENLKPVDFVEVFAEDTPVDLIKSIRPNIYVKGGDYKKEELPEYEVVTSYGGTVKILKFVDGFSTTSFIKKMQGKK